MVAGAIRKRCRECRRVMQGDARRMQWCDCGGEMAPIRYTNTKRKARRAG